MMRLFASYPRSARREASFVLLALLAGGLALLAAVAGFVALIGWHLQPRTACLRFTYAVATLQTDPPREVAVLHCTDFIDIRTGEVTKGGLLKK